MTEVNVNLVLIKYSSVSGSFKVTYVNKSLLTNSEDIEPIINPIIAQYVEVLNFFNKTSINIEIEKKPTITPNPTKTSINIELPKSIP